MNHDDFEELFRTLKNLIQAQIDEQDEDLAIIVSIVRQAPLASHDEWDELDNWAASLAFSHFISLNESLSATEEN